MLFWVAAALVTVLALGLILLPLMSTRKEALAGADVEIALYRSQLLAIDEEERAGRISATDADATRTEVKRRMLASAHRRSGLPMPSQMSVYQRRLSLIGLGLGVPLLALGLYSVGGRPELPDNPYASRLAERAEAGLPGEKEKILVSKLADRMVRDPADGEGWALLGGAYVRQGRFDDAVAAYENAKSRRPGDADVLSALGEAIVLQADGVVTEDARVEFEEAARIAPQNVRARYFLALAKAQAGDYAGAARAWRAMLEGAPENAGWRAAVQTELEQAERAAESASADAPP